MSVEFEKLTAGKLNPGAIVPQGLDNQWAPTNALRRMIKQAKPLISWKGRKKAVLSEWRRALIYAPQVVVNRVALFNNSIVVDDYSGNDKKNFQELLRRKVIVDYLLTEESPDQRPTFEIGDEKWNRWMDVIQDTKLACVRLDWGKQEDDFKNIAAVFHSYVQNLNMPDRTEHLTNAFRIPKRHREAFRKKLIEVASYTFDIASQGKNVVRNELYKKFVCVDNSKIDDGYYDKNKPFAAELKEIFDLRYTVNVPDAFGRYAFTPKGSPDRTVLGDVNQATMQNLLRDNRVKDFIDSLKRMQFAILNDALYLKGLDILSLADVLTIRNTDEWEQYTQSLNSLLRHPMEFAEKIDDVATRFNKLNRKITDMKIANTKKSAGELVSRLQPNMMIVVAIGGALMQLMLDPTDASRILVQTLSGPVSIGLAPIAINLRISASEYVDLGISVNFMRSKVNNGREIWREVQGALKDDPHFKFLEEQDLGIARDADQSKKEIDWNEVLG
ncbi:MAG: hypothetical protein HXY35_05495 [Chloroflexi bacterium]|nr:hypothetical protein [Chloroflexota bacterium]